MILDGNRIFKGNYLSLLMDEMKTEGVFDILDRLSEVEPVEIEEKQVQRVGQEQVHDLLFSEKLSWQSIIYDLINTEQLDPWELDLVYLTNKFLERIRQLEESNFFISSKVLLAAALLLRMKAELLLDRDLQGLDDILFGKKEEKKYHQERIELDEDVPGLIPRTPLPRFRKVSLEELMQALGKAINTENRRIRKVVLLKQQEIETALALPKKRINIQDSIKNIYSRLLNIFLKRKEKLAFSELAGIGNEERIATFIPLLHLDSQQKVWLEQQGHLDEIWILLKELYEKQNSEKLERMRKEVEEEMGKFELEMSDEQKERAENIEKEYANSLDLVENDVKERASLLHIN